MNDTERDTQLIAYLEGTLDGEARVAFEALLAADPALRAEVAAAERVRQAFRADLAVDDAPPPHLLTAILNAEVASRTTTPQPAVVPWYRRWPLLLGSLGGVTAAAAVLVLVSRSTTPASVAEASVAEVSLAPATVAAPTDAAAKNAEAGATADAPAANAVADFAVSTGGAVPPPAPEKMMRKGKATEDRSVGDAKPAPAPMAAALAEAAPTPPADRAEGASADDNSGRAESKCAGPMSKNEAQAELQRLQRERADRRLPGTAPAPAADGLASPKAMRASEQATMALATGERELAAKRYSDALDAFVAAEKLDVYRTLALAPIEGQLRAHAALKHDADVARLAARLLYGDNDNATTVACWRLGALAAQKTGDRFLETRLWERLREVPAHRTEAQAALRALEAAR